MIVLGELQQPLERTGFLLVLVTMFVVNQSLRVSIGLKVVKQDDIHKFYSLLHFMAID